MRRRLVPAAAAAAVAGLLAAAVATAASPPLPGDPEALATLATADFKAAITAELNGTTLVKPPPGACVLAPRFYPTPGYKPALSLTGRVAVVTGASSGIGEGVARALVDGGATVIGTSRTPGAYAGLPYPLLTLDQADPASVDAFVTAVLADPAVVARGGIDVLVLNAGRFVLGSPAPVPPATGATQLMAGIELGVATNYYGPVRLATALLPAVEAAARAHDGYGRIVFNSTPEGYAVGGAEPLSAYMSAYMSSKRALLAYIETLRVTLAAAGSPATVLAVSPMATNTRLGQGLRPIYTQPVDAAGNAVGDPGFQLYLDLMRTQLAAGLPPAFVASAFVQVLTEAKPPPAVAAGSWAKVGRVRGGNDLWAATATAENARSPFPFVEAKAAPADGAGVASVVDGVAADVRNAAAVVVGKG